ncbi:MAG: UDP-N-acetylmuramoyl-L-alanine--D-glutamate ligase, partial [Bacillota bacterium]
MDLNFKGKNVAVIGLGTENIPLIKYLKDAGANVCGRDMKNSDKLGERYQTLLNLGIELRLGLGYLEGLTQYDIVFLTPGIPRSLPELVEARRKGVRFSSQMELFFNICPATIIGITGSSGKTTTTTLVGNMLSGSGFDTRIGGNIGRVLLSEVMDMTPRTKVVLELSSFQLQDMKISPEIALITNITPNHLDVHKDMHEYVEAKKQIYLHQTSENAVVFNAEDPLSTGFDKEAPSRVYYFSKRPLPEGLSGAFIRDGWIVIRDLNAGTKELLVCSINDIRLLGLHNQENVLAASLVAYLVGAKIEAIAQAIREFKGVDHRLEYVATIGGVR